MKFVTLFAAGAAAAILPRAQIDVIKEAIASLRSNVQTFTTDINAYNKGDENTIRTDAKNIIQAINAADGDAKGMKGVLSDADAAGLATPFQDLGIDIGKAMDALISKKSSLVADCHGPEIYQSLVAQKMQSTNFQKDLMARISDTIKSLAEQVAKPINENLDRGLSAFKDQENVNCPAPDLPKTTKTGGSSNTAAGSSTKGSSPAASQGSSSSSGSQAGSGGAHPVAAGADTTQTGVAAPAATGPATSTTPSRSSNGTMPSYTGAAPTSTLARGSATSISVSFELAFIAAMAMLAL